MWAWSPGAAAELGRSHTALSRVDVLRSGRRVYTLEPVGGSVGMEAGREVRSNLSATLVDPSGALSRSDVGDLLNPYDCEVQPWRGVRVGGVEEWAPLGVFGLTSRSLDGDGSIQLTGQDRAMGYQGPMSSALAVNGGTPVEEAIRLLLSRRNPGLTWLPLATGFTVGPLLFAPDVDVWAEARKLAASVGADLFHDRVGRCVLALRGPASPTPVASYVDGGGLLLGVERAEDADTIRNVVVAESPDGLIRAVAEDTDPASPTFAGGRYGRRPVTLTNQHYTSVQQAQQAAQSWLGYELGRSETATFTAVPDPGQNVDEVVTVHRPRAGLERRGLVVASVAMPLTVTESMTVGCRRSVIAPDGRVLEPQEVTAA